MDELPNEILAHIFSFIQRDFIEWVEVRSIPSINYLEYLQKWVNIVLVNKRFLLEGRRIFDPTISENFAIRWASEFGCTSIVKRLLLDPRVDPTAMRNYAIRWACTRGRTKVVALLLDDGRVDPTIEIMWGFTPLGGACDNGHVDVIKLLSDDPRINPELMRSAALRCCNDTNYPNHHEQRRSARALITHPRFDYDLDNRIAMSNVKSKVMLYLEQSYDPYDV